PERGIEIIMAMEKTKTPGIYIIRGKRGKVVYRLYIKVLVPDPLAASGVRWKLKGKTYPRYQDALDAKVKIAAQVKARKYVEPSDKTVNEMVESWIEAGRNKGVTKHGPWKLQTYDGARGHLERHIAPMLGGLKASALRKVAVESAGAKWIAEHGLSA